MRLKTPKHCRQELILGEPSYSKTNRPSKPNWPVEIRHSIRSNHSFFPRRICRRTAHVGANTAFSLGNKIQKHHGWPAQNVLLRECERLPQILSAAKQHMIKLLEFQTFGGRNPGATKPD